MKTTFGFLFFLLGTTSWIHAAPADPLQNMDAISCPTQDYFVKVETPERIGPDKLKYWFVGPEFKWTPMAVEITRPGPYIVTDGRAVPQINPGLINLTKDAASGDFTIKCLYEAPGESGLINQPFSTLTLKAKVCVLKTATKLVSCKN